MSTDAALADAGFKSGATRTEAGLAAMGKALGEVTHSPAVRDRTKPAVRQSYRVCVDGPAIVVEFGLRLDGVPKTAAQKAPTARRQI